MFVPFVLIHLLWAVGVTWGLSAPRPGLRRSSLGRVGWLETPLLDRLPHIGWVAFAWPAIGTLNPSLRSACLTGLEGAASFERYRDAIRKMMDEA